jgi:hypothetical protein
VDFSTTKNILETLSGVGIEELVIEPIDKNKSRLRGANKERNIIVFDEVDNQLSGLPLGIMSVKAFLSRLELFDPDKASISVTNDSTVINNVAIKEGRKKASYKCADPSHLAVPKKIPGNLESTATITMSKERVDYLSQAITSLSYTGNKAERIVTVSIKDEVMSLSIFDGEDDTFSDEIECVGAADSPKAAWEVNPFLRVLKKSAEQSEDDTARWHITEHGIAVFVVGTYNIIVAPVA